MINEAESKKPKLLVVTTTYPRWEGDTWPPFVHELSSRLTCRYEVTVLTPRLPGAAESELRDNIHVKRFAYLPRKLERLSGNDGLLQTLKKNPLMVFLLPIFFFCMMWAIRKQVKQGATIIHAHWLPWGLLATLAAPRTPVLTTAHGSDILKLRGGTWRFFRRMTSRRAKAITTVSKLLADRLEAEGVQPEKIVVAPMGVDLKNLFVPDLTTVDKSIDLVFVGRFIEAKGPDLLIEAMRLIHQDCPETKLLMVGDGPLSEVLKARVRDYDLGAVVEFSGAIPNQAIARIFAKSNICVMPGKADKDGASEGLGLVAIEALGSGCRLISGSNRALQGMLPAGANAVFINLENAAKLASALIQMLRAETLDKKDFLIFRQALVDKFDWENVALNYDAILKKIVI